MFRHRCGWWVWSRKNTICNTSGQWFKANWSWFFAVCLNLEIWWFYVSIDRWTDGQTNWSLYPCTSAQDNIGIYGYGNNTWVFRLQFSTCWPPMTGRRQIVMLWYDYGYCNHNRKQSILFNLLLPSLLTPFNSSHWWKCLLSTDESNSIDKIIINNNNYRKHFFVISTHWLFLCYITVFICCYY